MLLAIVAMTVSSCSSDDGGSSNPDPTNQDATYSVTMDAGLVLNSVTYRKADGNFTTVNNISGSTWSITVQDVPENYQANADFVISNPTSDDRQASCTVVTPNGSTGNNIYIFAGDTETMHLSD